ncbi:Panacea domain-containing protein [Dietzia sp. UCD-THP]|uniref:Panacea domain-containing protein n=1 Tax=Dietzia sp. UCD-THP TaxID=1292020 RepID=UPI0009DA072A|nr:Panacea domain-containing protein [Dietzia sp. UCD-THP]
MLANEGDRKIELMLAYLCEKYPHKHELSKARITKMLYLSDWRASITKGRQLTSISWKFNHYGPYVEDAIDIADRSDLLKIEETANMYGQPKTLFSRTGKVADFTMLSGDERRILDHVIKSTRDLYWNDFISLVYKTYPIVSSERGTALDLPSLAKEYAES